MNGYQFVLYTLSLLFVSSKNWENISLLVLFPLKWTVELVLAGGWKEHSCLFVTWPFLTDSPPAQTGNVLGWEPGGLQLQAWPSEAASAVLFPAPSHQYMGWSDSGVTFRLCSLEIPATCVGVRWMGRPWSLSRVGAHLLPATTAIPLLCFVCWGLAHNFVRTCSSKVWKPVTWMSSKAVFFNTLAAGHTWLLNTWQVAKLQETPLFSSGPWESDRLWGHLAR